MKKMGCVSKVLGVQGQISNADDNSVVSLNDYRASRSVRFARKAA